MIWSSKADSQGLVPATTALPTLSDAWHCLALLLGPPEPRLIFGLLFLILEDPELGKCFADLELFSMWNAAFALLAGLGDGRSIDAWSCFY